MLLGMTSATLHAKRATKAARHGTSDADEFYNIDKGKLLLPQQSSHVFRRFKRNLPNLNAVPKSLDLLAFNDTLLPMRVGRFFSRVGALFFFPIFF